MYKGRVAEFYRGWLKLLSQRLLCVVFRQDHYARPMKPEVFDFRAFARRRMCSGCFLCKVVSFPKQGP